MKRVCVLTNFSSNFSAYSLCIVAERYVKMLVNNGYKISVVVMESFKAEGTYAHPNVELVKMKNFPCHNEWKKPDDPEIVRDTQLVYDVLSKHFKEKNIDVIISNDLFYQASNQKLDIACKKIAKEQPRIKWLHLIHSATSAKDSGQKFPNSLIIYPNSYDIPRVARAFNYEETEVKKVPHPIDVCNFFGMHEYSTEIIEKNDLLQADVIMAYPLRLDRGKQPEMVLKIAKALKQLGKTVKVIIMDFHSTGGDKRVYREELKKLAEKGGIGNDVIFTSEYQKKIEKVGGFTNPLSLECPRQMVKDFMCITNVYCHPSKSETFSLTTQEAMITGNFLILNFDFPPMRSIYGDKPLYRKFSSCININDGTDGSTDTKYGDEEEYFKDIARYINYMLEHDKIMSMRTYARKKFNLNAVFKKYLEPLLYYEGGV